MAYVAAVGDNIRMTTGHDVQGLTFSASSVGIKIGQGVGAAAVGWMLGMVGFDGTATSQPAAVLTVVSLSYVGLPVLISVARLLVFLPFRIYEANDELRADGA